MATLTGNAINTSYQGLVKFNDNGAVDPTTLKQLTDGTGGSLPIQVSQIQTKFQSSVDFTDATVSGLPTAEAGLVNGTATDSLKQADTLTTSPAVSSGDQAIALGNGARASGPQAVALGDGAEATNVGAAAVGQYAEASGLYSSAWGRTAYARVEGSVAFGQQAGVPNDLNLAGAVAMGRGVVAVDGDTTHVRALYIVAPDGGTGGNGMTLLSPNGTEATVTLADEGNLKVDTNPVPLSTGPNAIGGIWSGTQAQYDALGTYSATTLYFID
jgi:trimeric autotransporter adhesin